MPDIDKTKLKAHIIYADGTFAIIEGPREIIVIDKITGLKVSYYEFYLKPTLKTRNKWQDINDKNPDFVNIGPYAGFYKKAYKKDYCRQLDVSTKPTWLLSCDYHGNFIDLYNGEKTIWLDKIRTLRKQNENLRAALNSLGFELIKFHKDPMSYLKRARAIVDEVGAPIVIPSGGEIESGSQKT